MITSIQQAEQALQPYVPLVAQLTGKDTTLERIVPLMQFLGNPDKKLRAVHIAGTSGKTSTSYYIAALLQASGATVGLTVSPHIDSIKERVQIDGASLSDSEFCALLDEFLKKIATARVKPSYFELLYSFAIWVFAKYNVDYAVIETGLGGLYDATNVMDRPDKVCVITDIGFDHMHILGDTLAQIASQKIGIVHPRNTVLMYEQNAEIMQVVHDYVQQQDARLMLVQSTSTEGDFIATTADFQKRNWWLAAHVYEYLSNRDKLKHLTRQELLQTQLTYIPGRLDTVQIGDTAIVMDGAHNAQKMEAFISSFKGLYPNVAPPVLLALKHGKDYEQVVPLLAEFASEVVITTFKTSQDLPVVSQEPTELAAAFKKYGFTAVTIEQNNEKALDNILALDASIAVITGSFYLLSQLRHTKRYHDQTHSSHRS